MDDKNIRRNRRINRIRKRVSGTAAVPRFAVFRSSGNIYGQLIDDTKGHTLVTASSLETEIKKEKKKKTEVSKIVGRLIAQRAVEKGIKEAVFDRRGYKFHGRVKALAESARENGLKF